MTQACGTFGRHGQNVPQTEYSSDTERVWNTPRRSVGVRAWRSSPASSWAQELSWNRRLWDTDVSIQWSILLSSAARLSSWAWSSVWEYTSVSTTGRASEATTYKDQPMKTSTTSLVLDRLRHSWVLTFWRWTTRCMIRAPCRHVVQPWSKTTRLEKTNIIKISRRICTPPYGLIIP